MTEEVENQSEKTKAAGKADAAEAAQPAGASRRAAAVPEAPVTLISRPKAFDRNKAAREYEKQHPEFAALRMKAMRARHAGTHLKVFQSEPSQFFVNGMNAILATRMQGLPIVNPKLAVRSAPFAKTTLKDGTPAWFGVIVTPWSVQAILAPAQREGWKFVPAGAVDEIELQGGVFRFMSCADSTLGHYRMCSLKSPVFDLADQATADAFASACMDLMLGRTPLVEEPEPEARPLENGADQESDGKEPVLTRRGLLKRWSA